MRNGFVIVFCLLVFLLSAQEWKNLLEDNLSNMEKLNGTAEYEYEDGVLIGIAKAGTPNTFMATKNEFSDFILEFDVLIDNGMNSGVQFRSLSKDEYFDGRVHGYQVEIETSLRKWAGGIFDEARRGWLYPLTRSDKSADAFRPGEWNHIRLEAVGPYIQTWVNGIQCARLVDNMTPKGFIAFQVHSIGDAKHAGKKVRWKNIRILTEDLEEHLMKPDPSIAQISYLHNELTPYEINHGWRLLWDGETTEGWRGAKLDEFPEKGWKMEDGILTVLSSGGAESANGGDIVTIKEYSDFELELDFKISKGANSGIKYFVDPELNKGEGSAIGLEFQILDDENHPDAKEGKNGNRTVGSLYDLIRADNYSEANRGSKRFNGGDQWNRARILVKDGQVEHWLNGIKVVSFDRHSQLFKALVEKSKYENWENFGRIPSGHLLLQDHGDEVSFKNIKVREF
ncbi:3-keto-disaccharide hydrolase [Portibacter marinus]|uniref:3-keto-disaccharide hydrolase n=1 Tax=Portibacter marinus TaxID=2898660 RepID=UPI001F3AD0F6|nr:DUF1080 domain-containing protein [Portibacter marinus]